MRNLFSSKDQRLITRDETIDLSRATYSADLSSTGLDPESQNFHVSIDRVLFQTPVSMVQTILEAHGYVLNLENILACLDDLHLTVLAQLQSSEATPLQGKRYLPAYQFRLPSKLHVGPLLRRFYSEIESYETALKALKDDPKGAVRQEKKAEQNKDKLEALEKENRELKQEIKDLKLELQRATQSVAQANRALSDQNLMPAQIRLATVKEVKYEDRLIHLKIGRTALQFPLVLAVEIPEAGERCLVHIDNGVVKSAYFFEAKGKHIKPSAATVLFVKDHLCKVRDRQRRSFVLQAKNEVELALFKRLRRQDTLLLYYLGEHLLRFESLSDESELPFVDRLQEQLTQYQIYHDTEEGG